MYEPFEIPSLEQIEQMERQQLQALEALEYVLSEDGEPRYVKCQRCGNDVPIVGLLFIVRSSSEGEIKI